MSRPEEQVPQNLQAEESVLGAMMIQASAIDRVVAVLEPDAEAKFYRQSHATIYRAMREMHGAGRPVDAITLTDELELRGTLAEVGGRARVYELARIVPATANVAHYAAIVREQWVLRELIRTGGEIARLGWERPDDTDRLLGQAEEIVAKIRGRLERTRERAMTMYEAAEYLDEKFRNPPVEGFGVPTPWSFLPSMHGGRLYTLGGYQADGKTVQGAHFFLHALQHDVPSMLFSLEMGGEDMVERLAANMGLPAKRVQAGVLHADQRPKAAEIIGRLAAYGDLGRVIDAPAADIPTVRRWVQLVQPRFLIVDHLHQFHVRAEYERQDLEAIIRGLWQVAREFDIPVLLLAQLSRTGDKKMPYPRPTMASLRGSAMIEALSWAVYFVWRLRDERNLATEKTEWIVAKNRSGPTGIRDLVFHDRETRFTEIVHGDIG